MGRKKNFNNITIPILFEANLRKLLQDISLHLVNDEIVEFIVRLDLFNQDWGVTADLIRHFKALELEMIEEFKDEVWDLSPKKIEI